MLNMIPRRKVDSQSELPDTGSSDIPEVTKWQQLGDNSISKDLLYRNDVKISTVEGPESVPEFYDELKPVLYLMKAFGLFPLQRRKSEDSNFKRCKFTLLYSVLFYMGMNVCAFYECRKKIQSMGSTDTEFDELIFAVIHFMYILPHFYMIPCHWIEVSKVGKYFTHWNDFQAQFLTVTGKTLHLRLRKSAVLSVILVPIIGVIYMLCEVFLVKSTQFQWDMGFYLYIIIMIVLHVAWWWLVCSTLQRAMKTYRKNLFKVNMLPITNTWLQGAAIMAGGYDVLTTRHLYIGSMIIHLCFCGCEASSQLDYSIFEYESSALIVAQYRSLWISLSKLSRETGFFMFYSYGHLSVLAFTVMTLELYGSLSNIHDRQYLKHAGLALCVILSAAMVYTMANTAHHAADEIGTKFSEKLSCVCSSDKQVRRELKIFTQVMATNSSVINLGGYVALNRGFLLNFVATMVTYLIVLLQFRLGIMSLNVSANTTTADQYSASSLF